MALDGEIIEGPLPPVLRSQRLHAIAEEIRYVARPGLGALPSGTLAVAGFIALQAWTLTILFWAIWWPIPRTSGHWAFTLTATALVVGLLVTVGWLLLKRFPGYATALARTPFIRVTVTDRRVIWTVPWDRNPLMEIDRRRVTGAILGHVDRRGRGNAAMMLVPGDPAADVDGNIHFDRLPHAHRFVDAFAG